MNKNKYALSLLMTTTCTFLLFVMLIFMVVTVSSSIPYVGIEKTGSWIVPDLKP